MKSISNEITVVGWFRGASVLVGVLLCGVGGAFLGFLVGSCCAEMALISAENGRFLVVYF